MQSLVDLRSDRRVATDIFVNQILSDRENLFGRAANISRGGMCVFSLARRARGSSYLWICFWLPNSEELVRALCEVIHVRDAGDVVRTGVKFKYMSPRHKAILEQYLTGAHESSFPC